MPEMKFLYKNAKKEVDKEFERLSADGWKPKLNDDNTYSWVRGNEVRRGAFSTGNQGIDADAGPGDFFKRGRRQRRLMSEKVTGILTKKIPIATDTSGAGGTGSVTGSNSGGSADGTTDKSKVKTDIVKGTDTESTFTPKSFNLESMDMPKLSLRNTTTPQFPYGLSLQKKPITTTTRQDVSMSSNKKEEAVPSWQFWAKALPALFIPHPSTYGIAGDAIRTKLTERANTK